MSIEQYKTGTVSVTNNSNVVTGSGTAWLANIVAGNAFMIQTTGSPIYTVLAVDSDTQLRLTVNYAGTTGSGKAYTIQRSFDPIYGMPRPAQGDFDLPGMVTKIVDIAAGALAAGGAGGFQLTFANVVQLELAAAPRKTYEVYGDSTDGGTTPDATTQASINALLSAGVPQANIIWNYVQTGAGFQLPYVLRTPTITVPTLTGISSGSSGSITMPTVSMSETITAPTLTGIAGGAGSFTMPTQTRAITYTVPTLIGVQAGSFTMPIASMSETITVPTLVASVPSTSGLFTMPVASMTETIAVPSLTGISASGNLIPTNPGFESAIAGSENFGNWWPEFWHSISNGTATGVGERLASALMTGSYVGHLNATNGVGPGYCSNSSYLTQQDCEDNYATWLHDPDNCETHLWYKFAKSDIDATNGKITFDYRLGGALPNNYLAAFYLYAYDSGNALITKTGNNEFITTLAAGIGGGAGDMSINWALPAINVTRTVTNYDLKSRVVSQLTTGKTWADVSYVKLCVACVNGPNNGAIASLDMYVDNFR